MKRLFLVAGIAAVLIGCGGSGGDGSTTTGGGTTGGGGGTGREYPTFNFRTRGALMQTTFLSGQDRVLPRGIASSQIAVIRDIQYRNFDGSQIPDEDNNLGDEVRVQLDGYTINAKAFGVQMPIGQSSLQFTEFPLTVNRFLELNSEGQPVEIGGSSFTAPTPFDCDVRLFPGRISNLTVYLDDSMLSWNSATNEAAFNPDIFVAKNYNPIYSRMVSQFSDYVAFDISEVANKPQLSISGDDADRVYFSGDGYAMSRGLGQTSEFELLDPINVQNGRVSTGPIIGPNGLTIQAANVFILNDTSPDTSRRTAVVGTWRNFNDQNLISSASANVAVAFPTSRESDPDKTTPRQQFVMYRTEGGQVVDLWYGSIFYTLTDGTPTSGTFKLYPVETIDDAVPANEVNGTISNLQIVGGVVRRADWDVVGATPGGWPFGTSGGLGVFRQ